MKTLLKACDIPSHERRPEHTVHCMLTSNRTLIRFPPPERFHEFRARQTHGTSTNFNSARSDEASTRVRAPRQAKLSPQKTLHQLEFHLNRQHKGLTFDKFKRLKDNLRPKLLNVLFLSNTLLTRAHACKGLRHCR